MEKERKERYEKGLEDSKSMAFFCHHFYGHFSYISKSIKMFMKMSFNKSHTKEMDNNRNEF